MSVAIPVDCKGRRIVSATDLTPYTPPPGPKTGNPIPPGTTFPNGVLVPSDFVWTKNWQYSSNSRGIIGADGEVQPYFLSGWSGDGKIMAALLKLPQPGEALDPAYTSLPRHTELQMDDYVKQYRIFLNSYIPGDPADDADAQDWVDLAHNAAYTKGGGTTNYLGYATISLVNVAADRNRVLTDPKRSISMHTV